MEIVEMKEEVVDCEDGKGRGDEGAEVGSGVLMNEIFDNDLRDFLV